MYTKKKYFNIKNLDGKYKIFRRKKIIYEINNNAPLYESKINSYKNKFSYSTYLFYIGKQKNGYKYIHIYYNTIRSIVLKEKIIKNTFIYDLNDEPMALLPFTCDTVETKNYIYELGMNYYYKKKDEKHYKLKYKIIYE